MGEPRDDDQAGQRVQIPRNEADQTLDRQRCEADRADGDHIAERDDDRRQHDRHQQRGLDHALRRQVGAHDQKGEQSAERHGDRGHSGGQDDRGHKGAREVRLAENKRIGCEAQPCRGREKRFVEDALIDDHPDRQQDHRRQDRDRRQAKPDHARGSTRGTTIDVTARARFPAICASSRGAWPAPARRAGSCRPGSA